ncbi:MAG: flagellar basal body P-ring formation chaperone FlgA [Oceanobacter sp.]
MRGIISRTLILSVSLTIMMATANGSPEALQSWQKFLRQALLAQWQATQNGAEHQPIRTDLEFIGMAESFELPGCQSEPKSELRQPLAPGRNQILMSCDSPRWQYNLAVQLRVWHKVAILTRNLSSDETLTPELVHFAEQDIGELSQGYLLEGDSLVGMVSKRPLRAGTLLNKTLLQQPTVVQRGDRIKIQIRRSGLAIETSGVALADGRIDETIRVKNPRSGKVLQARVLESGRVLVE